MTEPVLPPAWSSASTPAPAARVEISSLIETLHAAGQRLGELTGGEVDSVTNQDGRTLLLRRSQDQLRHSEAAKQSAILNALPAQVALLDTHGRILSVNEAWRRFSSPHTLHGASDETHLNYLDVCDQAEGEGAADARQAAAGIRAVVRAEVARFSFEYICLMPSGPRWFLMTVTPLNAAVPSGAVVMHLDVTERKQGEESLLRFGSAMDAVADAIYLVDRARMCFVHVNDAACALQGLPRETLLALPPWQALETTRAALEQLYDGVILGDQKAEPVELQQQRPDGGTAWIELRRHAQRSGDRWMIVTLARDVTERRNAADRIAYLNRVYAVLSGINTLIVRVRDRGELFAEACRIAVTQGGLRMAMVAVVDEAGCWMVPTASAGLVGEALADVQQAFSSSQAALSGDTLAARAVRLRAPVVHLRGMAASADLQAVTSAVYERAEIHAMAVFPLFVADTAVGVLVLYAGEAEFFHDEELKLLSELAGDIAFAVDHIDKQERLDYLAYYDVLTGLANRSLFLERLAQAMRGATAGKHRMALYLIDLERFRNVNDSLGRPAGDKLLRQVAEWITVFLRDANLLARVGPNLFAVLLPQVRQEGDVARLLEKTMKAFLEHVFRLGDEELRLAAKVGIAVYPDDAVDADALFRNAEAALKKAKASGDRYLFYTQRMNDSMAGRLTLEKQLRQALERREYVLHYQPKIHIASGQLTGVEALIRWQDPRTGLVPTGRFIPVLEETGLIYEVGRWALQQAIADHLRWRTMGLEAVRIAVNVSALQLRHRGFIGEVQAAIGVDALASAGLELEITESLVMEDIATSIASLLALRAMGITVAIDDFGTGFSSLSYLARLPVDTLKIDRSFVVDMTTGAQGLALVSTIVELAHSLKLKVVAEGVETAQQKSLLKSLACDEMQGYLYSRPVPRETLEANFLQRVLTA
ncbi:MAG: hypothetical protein JWP29_2840 [Rhodoferax sp.]|nr:hypothetical protein [Rhodoferax sp.]